MENQRCTSENDSIANESKMVLFSRCLRIPPMQSRTVGEKILYICQCRDKRVKNTNTTHERAHSDGKDCYDYVRPFNSKLHSIMSCIFVFRNCVSQQHLSLVLLAVHHELKSTLVRLLLFYPHRRRHVAMTQKEARFTNGPSSRTHTVRL